ncbi:MAG: C10 family peptidase [candidate division Zixibacteria bacterium]|nr:C10 family peptidase [candidate division Zixibacteria bacterium]
MGVSTAMRNYSATSFLFTSLFVLFSLLFFLTDLKAETATTLEMDQVSENWLTKMIMEKSQWIGIVNPVIDKVEELKANDTLLGRVYSIVPEGYIIVPVLKELPAVKVYSDEGSFDVTATDGFPALVREVLQNRLRNFVDRYGSLEYSSTDDDETSFSGEYRQWTQLAVDRDSFKSNLDKAAVSTATVGPLLTTRWHQNAPYNNFCPYGDGGRTVVGCVATAAAQILAYHKWPPEGTGSHSYYWSGDNSCDGSTSGSTLQADYSDSYDWDNIPDYCSGCLPAEQNALAELCYEVGVAFEMDYGRCGSGAYTDDALIVFPTYFRYRDVIDKEERSSHSAASWFYIIASEIDVGRPMQYRISGHSIVCDGWRQVDNINQIHMNYGWGGSSNAWYAVDNLYCSWDGCNPMVEYLIRNIIPDKGVNFTVDTTIGWVPFGAQFTGESELAVDTWTWDFGDGDSAHTQSPVHTYITPGVYDVKLEVDAQGDIRSYIKADYIIALADSIIGTQVAGPLDSTLEIPINIVNYTPLHRLQIPIEYGGPLTLKYLGHMLDGCRTAGFDDIDYINYDANNKRFTVNMEGGTAPDLEPGSGPVIILRFKIQSSIPGDKTNYLIFDGYNDYEPRFYSYLTDYQPLLSQGSITYTGCCVGSTGNINCSASEIPDISDITRLIDYLYNSHAALCCPDEADCNGSGGEPDVSDITALIDHLYLNHNPLPDCP